MKLPYSWIKELSGVDWSVSVMEKRLTEAGIAGVAEAHEREHFNNVVVAQITALERHPNADKLVVAQVTTGNGEYSVICGAPNCAVGQKVVLALPGAKLQGKFEIKEVKMRGVKSAGMICAEDELGLSDDHSGIIVLDDDAPLNTPVYDYMNLGDAVINFEITPNRPDCLGAIGIAREAATLDGRKLEYFAPKAEESKEKASDYISVKIDDADACPRFTARIVKNIKMGPSPEWMQKRLLECGMRPINVIVDITNYVMLEMNHPMHAFDYDRFGSREVVVRRAQNGEKFTTLDGQDHTLDNDILMITNGREGVGAAGVMGGLNSEVYDDTKTIMLEVAYFKPSVIRRSRRKLNLQTEASFRFERGIDPNTVHKASERAVQLMAELAGGEVLAGVVDNYARKIEPVEISLRPSRVKRLLGIELDPDFIITTLTNLGCEVTNGERLKVTVPTYRPDITREVDLIEELARIHGLDKIPVATSNSGPLYSPTHRRDTIKSDLRSIMTGFGFDEMLGTGFANPDKMKKLDPNNEPIVITNPISDEFGYLRTRLLYSLLTAAGHNLRHRNLDFKLFEIGRVYLRGTKEPRQPLCFGLIISGKADEIYWKHDSGAGDLFEIKGAVAAVAGALGIGNIEFRKNNVSGYDNDQSFELMLGNQSVGYAGLADSRLCKEFEIKQECYAAELFLDPLIAIKPEVIPFRPLPRFPASTRDIAVIVDNAVPAGELHDAIIKAGGDLVESVKIFDLFTGKPVPSGQKSLAFALSFRSGERTLEDEEVDGIVAAIVDVLKTDFAATLRE